MITTGSLKAYALSVFAGAASLTVAVGDESMQEPVKANPSAVIVNGIPKSIEPAIGKSSDHSYLARIKTVHGLGIKLSPSESEALLGFLAERYSDTWGFMTPLQFNAVKNETTIVLAKQDMDLTPEISDLMMEMLKDKSYDEMWRNYCVQFMGQLYSRMDADRRARCVQLLWPAVEETATCIPGAALIALSRIEAIAPKAVAKDALARTAYDALTAQDAIEINKTTALQTCAQLKYARALPVARAMAANTSTPIPLRISAIAAVGQLGDDSDKDLLTPLKSSSDTRMAITATAALKMLANR